MLGPLGLGTVAVGLALGMGVVATCRAVTGETALVYGASDELGPLAAGLLISGSFAVAIAVTSTFARGASNALLLLALGLVLVVAQDTLRYRSFAERRPSQALISDLTWLAVQSILLFAVWRLGRMSPAFVLGAWLAGAGAGSIVLARRRDSQVRLKMGVLWMRRTRKLSAWLGAQALASQVIAQALIVIVGAIAGLSALGGIRAGQTLISPFVLLLSSVPPLLLPLLGGAGSAETITVQRSARESPGSQPRQGRFTRVSCCCRPHPSLGPSSALRSRLMPASSHRSRSLSSHWGARSRQGLAPARSAQAVPCSLAR